MTSKSLLVQISNEKIVYPVNQRQAGWNDAIQFIIDAYGPRITACQPAPGERMWKEYQAWDKANPTPGASAEECECNCVTIDIPGHDQACPACVPTEWESGDGQSADDYMTFKDHGL